MPRFSPAQAYWNQRTTLANARDQILSLCQAVNKPSDLCPYQWAQLMAVVLDYQPDLVLDLGRGNGNSTCAFTAASNLLHGRVRVLSLCQSDHWERETVPRLKGIVPDAWFAPLQALRTDILSFDYPAALSEAKRVLLFWDAHGSEIAECVLGEVLPILANIEHLVIMHDLSDTRYQPEDHLEYGENGLWRGNNWTGSRWAGSHLKIGIIDTMVEQAIAAVDFTTRNHITLDSADHSFHTGLSGGHQAEMCRLLGELFNTQAHWFYFSLNERPGPYKFPHYTRPSELTPALVESGSNITPYLSLVVTARNDDHGGSLLRRMQAFVNGWIGQSQRHGLSSELIVVDWNPPPDRPPLIEALQWPQDARPCDVRFIQVPPEIHRRYRHAGAMPLYQMIAKNAGIRRARGRFVLATNIDILFSDELVHYLAQGRLDPGRMYRIDRHDVMKDVPVDGTVDDQLAYCRTHLIRVNACEGTFRLAPEGLRALNEEDIARADSGISFGAGWFAVERDLFRVFRWMDNDAEVVITLPGTPSPLILDVEPGPGAGGEPLRLQAVDGTGRVFVETEIRGRAKVEVPLAAGGNFVRSFRLRVLGGGLSLPHDPRILNLRVFRCEWASAASLAGATPAPQKEGYARKLWIRLMHLVNRLAAEEPVVHVTLRVPWLIRRLAQVYVGVGGFTGLFRGGVRRYRESRKEVAGPPAALLPATPFHVELSGPVLLHTNACGDFTLMARERWFDLRAYPEFDMYSFNLDSLLCYAAHHGGAREEILRDPLRIYHIEHGTGSGWTPEGQAQLFDRLRQKGISWLEYRELIAWAAQMRRLNAPIIFNRENWGLADQELKETMLPAAAVRQATSPA